MTTRRELLQIGTGALAFVGGTAVKLLGIRA